jgi:hypothetical protein
MFNQLKMLRNLIRKGDLKIKRVLILKVGLTYQNEEKIIN